MPDMGRIIIIIITIFLGSSSILLPLTPAHTLSDSSPVVAYCKDGVHHGGAAKQVD